MAYNGTNCPLCGGDMAVAGELTVGDTAAYRDVRCLKCVHVFLETFELVSLHQYDAAGNLLGDNLMT